MARDTELTASSEDLEGGEAPGGVGGVGAVAEEGIDVVTLSGRGDKDLAEALAGLRAHGLLEEGDDGG